MRCCSLFLPHCRTSLVGSLLLSALLCCGGQRAFADSAVAISSGVPTSLEAVLHGLADQADVIFTGEVTAIERTASAMEVHWQVETAVRGVAAGQQFTLREWSGLWQANSARYVKGQRALLLLHAPSAAGYASPVGGADGVISLQGDNGSGTLNLALLQQRVLVTDAARMRPVLALRAAGGSLPLSNALQRNAAAAARPKHAQPMLGLSHSAALQRINDVDTADATESATAPASSTAGPSSTGTQTPTSSMDASVVMGMLQAWQRQRGAAR